MDSNKIARMFYERGQGDKWLSRKQTSWLYDQACREAGRKLTNHGTPVSGGLFTLENGTALGWEISVSPQNGCAMLRITDVSALQQKREEELAESKRTASFLMAN